MAERHLAKQVLLEVEGHDTLRTLCRRASATASGASRLIVAADHPRSESVSGLTAWPAKAISRIWSAMRPIKPARQEGEEVAECAGEAW
jgi:propanediol dehydratase small subunit